MLNTRRHLCRTTAHRAAYDRVTAQLAMVKPLPPPNPDLLPLPGRRRSIAKSRCRRVPARLRHKSKDVAPVGLPLAPSSEQHRGSGPAERSGHAERSGSAGRSGHAERSADTAASAKESGAVEALAVTPKLDDPFSNHGIAPQPAVYVDEEGMEDSNKPGFYATVDSGATYKWHRKLEDVRDWFTATGYKVSKSKLDNINVRIEASAGRVTKRANADRVIHMNIAPLPRGVWFMSKAEFTERGLRSTVSEYDDLPVVYDADIEDNDITEISSKELDDLTGEMESFCVQIARATVVRTNEAQDQTTGTVRAYAVGAVPLPPPEAP